MDTLSKTPLTHQSTLSQSDSNQQPAHSVGSHSPHTSAQDGNGGSFAPYITVIVPVYKVEAYLRQCIDSILAQTFADFELLLIDDGSPDTSGAICDEYAAQDKRVRVFHQENKGPSAARNTGLDNARGQWIAFVDSDDTVTPAFLETFARLQKTHGADLVVTSYNHIAITEKTAEVRVTPIVLPCCIYEKGKIYRFPMSMIVDLSVNMAFAVVWNKLFSCALIRENGLCFDVTLSRGEDTIFFATYLKYVKCLVTSSSVTYNYIKRGGAGLGGSIPPLDAHFRFADTLYELEMDLSHEPSYIEKMKYGYSWNFSWIALRRYREPAPRFTRKERIKILKELKSKVEERGIESQYYEQLRQYAHTPFRNVYLIELNGAWLKLKHGIKTCIKACLPNGIVQAIRVKNAKKAGVKTIYLKETQVR